MTKHMSAEKRAQSTLHFSQQRAILCCEEEEERRKRRKVIEN
jgi:hypothetical protein